MFEVGDRVRLILDAPDDNNDLGPGEEGTIILDPDRRQHPFLVRWDSYTEQAKYNDHLIQTIWDPDEDCGEWEWDNIYDDHSGHLWYTLPEYMEKIRPNIAFRNITETETTMEYKIVRKINELDTKWKEKQLAKTNSLSL